MPTTDNHRCQGRGCNALEFQRLPISHNARLLESLMPMMVADATDSVPLFVCRLAIWNHQPPRIVKLTPKLET
jgi:hypothetical protein